MPLILDKTLILENIDLDGRMVEGKKERKKVY
jgi:hypothetical protein